jgi:16S rRNA G966 N2-methylase RsmD
MQPNLDYGAGEAPPSGYYSGDQANPRITEFVQNRPNATRYFPEEVPYDTPAFDKPLESSKSTAVYNMHTYWSKKPHDAIRHYIKHYTKPHDLVLDPFCGSGGTALAALSESRAAIAIDRSPAATFITSNYCVPVDQNAVLAELERLMKQITAELSWLYETKCDGCGGEATITYTVYSQVYRCRRCLNAIPYFDTVVETMAGANGKPKVVNYCPICRKKGHDEAINTRDEKLGPIPVLVNYLCHAKCKPSRRERRHNDDDARKQKYFRDVDLAHIAEIDAKKIPYSCPRGFSMEGFSRYQRDALYYYGVKEVADLYTKRNLWALAGLRKLISGVRQDLRPTFQFAFSSILFGMTRMYRWSEDGQHDIVKGTFYLPPLSREINALQSFETKFSGRASILALPHTPTRQVMISTQTACSLGSIPSNTVDYVFTDPPYAEKIQYGELNYIWEAWLDLDTHWHAEEIIVNETRGKTEADWAAMMGKAMSECYRVLKPGRWLSLCYHDTSEGTWSLIQDIMAEVGFIVDESDSALFIGSEKKSYNQEIADKVTKRDLVINFRKPRLGEIIGALQITGTEDEKGFAEKVRTLIADFLGDYPGATKDRVYDFVVSRMVRAGQMQAHNFEEFLKQMAEPVREAVKKNLFEDKDPDLFGSHEIERWYLKVTQLDVFDAAESDKEDAAAERLGKFISKQMKGSPWLDGIHYSDLFEEFVYSVKDKPRRPMAEWLLDYFFKTESGTYRLAVSEEEARIKTEGRSKGTGRRIKRYLAFLEQGIAIPTGEQQNDSTLADWIRHAKLSGMYEAGKLLFERGGLSLDRLSEEAAVNVEEDYQVCVRMLSRQEKG